MKNYKIVSAVVALGVVYVSALGVYAASYEEPAIEEAKAVNAVSSEAVVESIPQEVSVEPTPLREVEEQVSSPKEEDPVATIDVQLTKEEAWAYAKHDLIDKRSKEMSERVELTVGGWSALGVLISNYDKYPHLFTEKNIQSTIDRCVDFLSAHDAAELPRLRDNGECGLNSQ